MNRILFGLVFTVLCFSLNGQIVTLDPPFPTVDDDVTIYYDASQGSGELAGVQPVFMHSGVITESGGPGSWQYVVGNWGTFDGNGVMTPEGNNIHSKTINIRNFYGIPQGEVVTELAMVFRNQDGSLEGKTEDYQDIFVPIYSSSSDLLIAISSPEEEVVLTSVGETIDMNVNISQDSDVTITEDGTVVASGTQVTSLQHTINVSSPGEHEVIATATNGTQTVADTFTYIVNPSVNTAEPPAGVKNGINVMDDNTVIFQLWAPYKNYVYVIGDFNDWAPNLSHFMNRSSDGATWWLEVTGLDPNEEYAFQYYVDGDLKIADPYSTKILDPWNDPWIGDAYPDLKPYPGGQTSGIVSAFQTVQPAFNWQHDDYDKPAVEDLVIYELLIRDFHEDHSFQSVMDSLDYLERLGINAIQFMPVNEFEGNNSWGYNPSFHMALDKYYGPAESFKELIDECHSRGIAVIVDVVYNHHFSQSPLAQLYWDNTNFQPAPENPWLNMVPFHPFNVGSDMNHEAQATKDWLDQVMVYWVDEFHLDGFRFDLSKGFTQNYSTDVGAWGQYDQSRIDLIKRMADVLWAADPDFYVTLEHLSDASEERELSDYGMQLWGNGNHEYNEASMAYNSNLSGIDYGVSWRDFNDPHLIGYMESHDEERLMYKNLQFGNSGAGYDIQDLATALDREELVANFFFTIPGPKLMWQFGEVGYDFSINRCENGTIDPDCRLAPKPIRWDYYDDPDRRDVYDVWSSLIQLKTNHEVFKTTDYSYDLVSKVKRINLNHSTMNVAVIGNFDVMPNDAQPLFQHTGWWYEYFTGDSVNVTDVNMSFNLDAGGYMLFTDQFVNNPNNPTVSNQTPEWVSEFVIAPNPSNGQLNISLQLDENQRMELALYDISGRKVKDIYKGSTANLYIQESWEGELPSGVYFLSLQTEKGIHTQRWIKQ